MTPSDLMHRLLDLVEATEHRAVQGSGSPQK